MPVNMRTIKVLGIIALVLIGAFVIARISAAHRTGRHLEALATQEPDKVMDALDALRARGKVVGPQLAALVQAGHEDAAPRAAWLLGMTGSHAGDQELTQALNSDKPVLRIAAMHALGQLQALSAVPAISGILAKTEEKLEMRVAAAYALGSMGNAAGVKPLVAALNERPAATPPADPAAPAAADAEPPPDETIPVRLAAARALGQISDRTAVDPLIVAVSETEPDPEVRVAAAYALGDVAGAATHDDDSERAVSGLLKGLKDEAGDVRVACAYALAKTKPPAKMTTEVAAAIEDAREDDHYWTRLAADRTSRLLRLPE